MTLHAALILVHVLAAAFWVGGMATLQTAVRPAVAETLAEPPRRLALMVALLRRFFLGVTLAIAVLLGSGFAMIALAGGMSAQPLRVHAMTGAGLLMMAIFGHIRLVLFARLQRGVAASDWPAAAAALAGIRSLVSVNLGLGIVVFAIALLGRALAGLPAA
jgi:uncharacterized membrane protein